MTGEQKIFAVWEKGKTMSEYIVRETGYPGAVKQEVIGELVRCKDCKHSHPWYADRRTCVMWSETGVSVFNDGFCSYGERKDDETERA